MAESDGKTSLRANVSAVGAFLIAFLLGGGIMFIFHTYQAGRFEKELIKLREEQELRQREAADAIAELNRKILELQKKAGGNL